MFPEAGRPKADFRLYAVTDRSLLGSRFVAVLGELCADGLRGVELREKDLPEKDLLDLALACRPAFEKSGARWLVNSSLRAAKDAGASGVHLPGTGSVGRAREYLGEGALIGKSVHSAGEALEAASAGADFLAFGPVFSTPSKEKYGPARGLDALAEACAAARVPVFAVGGVSPERVRDCLLAGAHGVAVIRGLWAAQNPRAALREYEKELGRL